ncbi:MAG: hypothetical protein ACI861_002622 [Paracoccaceae bacterium]
MVFPLPDEGADKTNPVPLFMVCAPWDKRFDRLCYGTEKTGLKPLGRRGETCL